MTQMMKAIVKAKAEPGGLEFRNLPVPEPGPGQVLLKNRAVAICGTDLHIYNWDAWSQRRVKPPIIIGHEFAADVVKLGDGVNNVKVGDYVSGEGHLVCGFCDNCRTGNGHVCYDWKGIGYDVDGAFAEYFLMPERNIWKNDPLTPADFAACQDPLGNAIHTVFRTNCVGKKVAVFGLGPIGLLAVATLSAIGAGEIFAFDWDNDYRCRLAKQLGAHHVVKSKEQDPLAYIRQHTGVGVDVALEMAGSQASAQTAIKGVKMAGEVVFLAAPSGGVNIDLLNDVVFRSVSLYGITGRRIWDTWFTMRGLLKSGNLAIDPVITHHFSFDEYEKGFALMQSAQCGKVVLELK